jgi:N-acetylneuraminate synthase
MRIALKDKVIGPGMPCYVIAEIGINHNGDIDIAEDLICAAADAGCDAVKFQKRTVDVVYSQAELDRPRESPFGKTNGDLKRGLELNGLQYERIDEMCREVGVQWLASCWDEASVDFVEQFDPPAYKIASASLTDDELLRWTAATGRPILLSTGMSTLEQVDHAVAVLEECRAKIVVMHCVSTYPAVDEDLNLSCIPFLRDRYGLPTGYSGHEIGLATTLAAVALGACCVERHVTLNRAMWGSDHAASIEPHALTRLVRDIRAIEKAMGDGEKRVLAEEFAIQKKLRRVG